MSVNSAPGVSRSGDGRQAKLHFCSLDTLLPLLSDTSASVRRSMACAFASVGTIKEPLT
jgi:hypothetical protein